MNILEVSEKEYKTFVVNPFSGFDKVEFVKLNKHKVNEVKYFIFENNKKRFGLVAGIKENVFKCPSSATFGIFSEITHNNKIQHYHEAINSLIEWAKNKNIKKIIFCCPANFYQEKHITKFQNALFCNGFQILDYDVNFEYELSNFKNGYMESLNSDSRRNLKLAIKEELIFEKTDDINTVYSIIKQNREEKGFPLWMSAEDIKNTTNIIKSDFFLVKTKDEEPIASAYIQRIKDGIANVVYWGNLQKSDRLYPMNFIAYKVFEYYSNKKNIHFISIGTSTKDSEPNYGLCDFKESIGCKCSAKLNFVREL